MWRKFILPLVAVLSSLLLTAPAFASDVRGGEFAGGSGGGREMGRLLNAMEDLVDVMEQVFAIMTSNPLLLVLLAGSLLSLGVWIFRKVKGAAK